MKIFRSLIQIALGIALLAFGVINFSVPNYLAIGGVTGITLLLYHGFGIGIGLSNLLINLPLLVVGFFLLERKAFFLTLLATGLLSFFFAIFELIGPVVPTLHDDMILAVIGFGLCAGVGIGLVFRAEGTTGGTAIISKFLKDKAHVPVATSLLAMDVVVIGASLLVFLSFYTTLYTLIGAYIMSLAISKVQEGQVGYQVLVISDHSKEIAQLIQTKMKRGVTLLHGTGAYTNTEKEVVLVMIGNKQLVSLKKLIHEVDPQGFVSVSHTYETLGNGFTWDEDLE